MPRFCTKVLSGNIEATDKLFLLSIYTPVFAYQWEFFLKRQCQLFHEYPQPLDARKFHDQFDQGYNQATSLSQHYGQESKENDEQILSNKPPVWKKRRFSWKGYSKVVADVWLGVLVLMLIQENLHVSAGTSKRTSERCNVSFKPFSLADNKIGNNSSIFPAYNNKKKDIPFSISHPQVLLSSVFYIRFYTNLIFQTSEILHIYHFSRREMTPARQNFFNYLIDYLRVKDCVYKTKRRGRGWAWG